MTARLALVAACALAGCGEAPPAGWPGYVEAEYVRVAAPLGGSLAKLAVARGDAVAVGAPLFALESEQERAARAEAQARFLRAQAVLANLEKSRRPPEIAAARAQLAQAQAVLGEAENELARGRKLIAEGFVSPQKLDELVSARDAARARVAEAEAQLALANMPARSDEIAAARAEAKAAQDVVAQAQWRLDQRTQTAPAAGRVVDTLFRPGEWVPPGTPVVSLLPPENVKVRFYVPEPALSGVRVGQAVRVRCDGCPAALDARVTFVAPQAEFTPPVIYSRENRAKLVFLVEAKPAAPDPGLHPGLPVEVLPAAVAAAKP